MSPKDHAEQQLAMQREERRKIAQAYTKVFGSDEGRQVLADLERVFDPRASRFPSGFTKANPLAAFFGGIHYDGSAAVVNHILERMAEANEPEMPMPEMLM